MAKESTKDTADLNDPWLRSYFMTRHGALDRDRIGYWDTWKDIARNFCPKRGRFNSTANDTTRGRRKDQRIIDNTPMVASRVLQSGMMAGISSPARPWFRLRFSDPAANEVEGARAWLDEVQSRILHVFARSNLYNCLHSLYGEIGDFGTAALMIDEDEETVVRGYMMTVGEYWLASSERQRVDTIYRSFWWTVRQIVLKFGRDKVSDAIRASYDNGQLDGEYEIVQAIEPNPNAQAPEARIPAGSAFPWDGRLASQLPYRSVWYERGTSGHNLLLRVSGYHEFPAMCPRWEVTGTDTYGSTAPGWMGLGDAQQLQVEQRRKTEVIDKLSKPPMKGPPYLQNRPASALPGGMTIVAEGQNGKFEPAFMVHPEGVTAISNSVQEVQKRINDTFYVNLFLAMLGDDRQQPDTAREVQEKHEEKMLMLGPVLERVHEELLDPAVKRVFNVMARKDLIPPPPEGIDIGSLQVEFVSILAQAQKASDVGVIERAWQFAGQIAQLGRPDVLDRLDADATMDLYTDLTGAPGKILVSIEKAQQARQAASQKQAQAEQMQALNLAATTGKTASQIDVGGGQNAVSAALGGAPSP
jgi:hypothetical protein